MPAGGVEFKTDAVESFDRRLVEKQRRDQGASLDDITGADHDIAGIWRFNRVMWVAMNSAPPTGGRYANGTAVLTPKVSVAKDSCTIQGQ